MQWLLFPFVVKSEEKYDCRTTKPLMLSRHCVKRGMLWVKLHSHSWTKYK
jgi:hypothetical protein